ncbi:MAG: lyase family protein, partial [Bacteriovorax sp.]|nr:lyase family protein [Bacteriovorax sp.]
MKLRKEIDSLGELNIPANAYFGIQSFRASENFQISGTQVHPLIIKSYLLLKKAAALANQKTKSLDENKSKAIVSAVDQLLNINLQSEGQKYFIIDAYQAGAGTSQNMNANEVIANKANEILGNPLGSYLE